MTSLSVATAALAGLAICVAVPDPSSRRLVRRLSTVTDQQLTQPNDRRSTDRQPSRHRWPARIALGCCASAGLVSWLGWAGLLVVPLTGVGWLGISRYRTWRHARAAELARAAAVREVCEVLSAELRAGRTPIDALATASSVLPELRTAVAAGRWGGDVPAAIRETRSPGAADALRSLASAWTVADHSGAGLAGVLDRLTEQLRTDDELRSEISAQLAGPRATARVVAALPIAGLGLGYSLGADPLAFLLGTPIGLGCLFLGAGLVLAGLVWVQRLAHSAELRP